MPPEARRYWPSRKDKLYPMDDHATTPRETAHRRGNAGPCNTSRASQWLRIKRARDGKHDGRRVSPSTRSLGSSARGPVKKPISCMYC